MTQKELIQRYPELTKEYIHPDATPGWNLKNQLCKSCLWRNRSNPLEALCDYIGYSNHPRGCCPADCTKYHKQHRGERALKYKQTKVRKEIVYSKRSAETRREYLKREKEALNERINQTESL